MVSAFPRGSDGWNDFRLAHEAQICLLLLSYAASPWWVLLDQSFNHSGLQWLHFTQVILKIVEVFFFFVVSFSSNLDSEFSWNWNALTGLWFPLLWGKRGEKTLPLEHQAWRDLLSGSCEPEVKGPFRQEGIHSWRLCSLGWQLFVFLLAKWVSFSKSLCFKDEAGCGMSEGTEG